MRTLYTITATKNTKTTTLECLTAKQVNAVQALGYTVVIIDKVEQNPKELYNSIENTYTL